MHISAFIDLYYDIYCLNYTSITWYWVLIKYNSVLIGKGHSKELLLSDSCRFPKGNARGKYEYSECEQIYISLMQGKLMFYSTRPTFWWILTSFFQNSLLVLWFWYYIVTQPKLSTYFSTKKITKTLNCGCSALFGINWVLV